MWLTDLLSGGQVSNNAGIQVPQQSAQNNAQLNKMIQNLAPGQTLQGEVVSKNGNEVQIRLSDDMVLNARLDQNMNLEVGKNMTFEVRNNGQNLTLSPLFANTATQANALKALEMASLPVNQNTVAMTGLMMEAGLSVDRNSLQQMFREVNSFPQANLSDVVDLHKYGLEVNEGNLAQISSYKNLTHQIVEGLHTIQASLPETIQGMLQEGDLEGAAKMFQELLQLVREVPEEAVAEEQNGAGLQDGAVQEGDLEAQDFAVVIKGEIQQENQNPVSLAAFSQTAAAGIAEAAQGMGQEGVIQELAAEIADGSAEALLSMVDGKKGSGSEAAKALQKDVETGGEQRLVRACVIIEENTGGAEKGITVENRAEGGKGNEAPVSLTQEVLQLIRNDEEQIPRYGAILQQIAVAEQNGDLAGQAKGLQQLLQQGLKNHDQHLLAGLLSGNGAKGLLAEGLSKLWTIEPRQVADAGKVEELYQRLDRQLKSMSKILEQGGQTESSTFKAVTNMNQNLDFMQQINQAYTYVQLPLRLQQGDAHGDLYVYTNKRNLAAKDGQISALLHLDMEHLGPVDVYVAMQAEHVNTRFYVQDDEMLDFLEAHMDLLTQRLQKRGYHCDCAMQVRGEKEGGENALKGLAEEKHALPVAQYAFDVRA